MQNFAAIDFEAANAHHTSVCSVGVVVVRDGCITDRIYSLIYPEPNKYDAWCTKIHGISQADTVTAPLFPDVWEPIAPLIEGLPLVAHGMLFDQACLIACHKFYNMRYPNYKFFCTLKASQQSFPDAANHKLQTIAALCGYQLTHQHNALADAEACAFIARAIIPDEE
ncbi:MAG: 3'-5' exoribonuclease [Bacteroidales bacterium]|nr:3'-5' exoribonuclease [Candidatus Colimorpha onthohippi]